MLLLLLLLPLAFAGERSFAFTYGYGTVPKGGIEVEHYLTMYGKDGDRTRYWEHQVELEYGISDRLEAGVYVNFGQWDAEDIAFRKYKARLRYRLGSQGVAPIDVGLYLEYIGTPTLDSHGVEAKLLLAKDVDRFISAMDLEYAVEFEEGGIVHELEPTLGLGWRFAPWFALGVEGKFEAYFRESGLDGPYAWAGPSLHLAGEGGRLWWTFAVLAPVTGDTMAHEGFVARSLIALNL